VAYQADFLPIGKSQCGDSFIVRFGDLSSANRDDHTVIIIDGGFTEDWKIVRDTLLEHYHDTRIDLAISTHPDQDHINGLSGVLENLDVRELWMHAPWLHSQAIEEAKANAYNVARLDDEIKKELSSSQKLFEVALVHVPVIREPFAGETIYESAHGLVRVVGPSRDYYESLLPQFFDWSKPAPLGGQSMLKSAVSQALRVAEKLDVETLRDKGETSPQNNTSAMVLIEHGDAKLLFTGDGGREALELTCAELEYLGHMPGSYQMVQVPHHGSRHNVGPSILTRLLGDRVNTDGHMRGHSYVSAASECADHPQKAVLNAFRRRGYPVISTEGIHRLFQEGAPRTGWVPSIPHPLYAEVEADD
jgi:hypothetical protein